jgi:DNA polymerase III delta prime subunit
MRLTEKYKPSLLTEFIGLEEPKKIIGKWLANPYPTSFLFVGDSGTGKTQMGHAIAKALRADGPYSFIHVPSQKCNVEAVARIQDRLIYAPWGDFWVVLIDEADQMSPAAQIAFLSLLDRIPERTVIIFTCNEVEKLESRFLSRCAQIKFSNYA